LDISGSIRPFFEGCDYVGVDIAPGPGVDIVCQGQHYAPTDCFDVVASCEVMEHNPFWAETFVNMVRLCRPGGLVLMTCASRGRREHGTARTSPGASPLTVSAGWNYYCNLRPIDFCRKAQLDRVAPRTSVVNWRSRDLYIIGFKPGRTLPVDTEMKLRAISRHYRMRNAHPRALIPRLLVAMLGQQGAWKLQDCLGASVDRNP